MKPVLAALGILILTLGGCAGALPALLLGGGGPKVAANGQAGRTNAQTVGQTTVTEQTIGPATAHKIEQSGTNTVHADQVQKVVVNQTPLWLILAFAAAVFLDSPLRWPAEIAAAFRRKPKPKASA